MLSGHRLLVVSGSEHNDFVHRTEIFDLRDPNYGCDLPFSHHAISGSVGGLTKNGLLFCGGWDYATNSQTHECYTLTEDRGFVRSTTTLALERDYAKGLVINGSLWVTGGATDPTWNPTSTTELLDYGSESFSVDLPQGTYSHCIAKINATHGIITGGTSNKEQNRYDTTHFINFATMEISDGPKLNVARAFHGCSVFENQGKLIAMIGGGSDASGLLDSTEFLDLEAGQNLAWTQGPSLPKRISGFPLVTTTEGTEVIAVGGTRGRSYEKDILKMSCPEELDSCAWSLMEHKLEVARAAHTAILIPDTLNVCQEPTE